jgi:uncharacterized protein (TIGR04255 family)
MPFPESPRVIFGHNPLREVICQLKFPTILELSSREPVGFQNSIRMRFPFYETDSGVAFPSDLPQEVSKLLSAALPSKGIQTVHRFASADRRNVASLTSDFVAFATTGYAHWDEFLADLEFIREAFETNYQTPFYVRIGLRYRNVIDRNELGVEAVPWSQLLRPSLLGMLAEEATGTEVERTLNEVLLSVATDTAAKVRVRHGLLENREVNSPEESVVYLIDSDFFLEGQIEPVNIVTQLTEFHTQAGNLFRWFLQGSLSDALHPGAP